MQVVLCEDRNLFAFCVSKAKNTKPTGVQSRAENLRGRKDRLGVCRVVRSAVPAKTNGCGPAPPHGAPGLLLIWSIDVAVLAGVVGWERASGCAVFH